MSVKPRIVGVLAQIILNLSRQDQLDVFHRRVVDQVVQRGALVHVAGDLVFDGDAVDSEDQGFAAADFDAGGVDVVFAGDLFHGILLSVLWSGQVFEAVPAVPTGGWFLRHQCSRPERNCRMCERKTALI